MPSQESGLEDKIEILTSGIAEVLYNAADTPGSFTGILSEILGQLLKASPFGFSSDRLQREPSKISPSIPEPMGLSHGNHNKIWLYPVVQSCKPPKDEAADDIFLNLRLRLGNIDISMIDEIASQSLPHVNEIRFEILTGPTEEIGYFTRCVLQAAKLRPLMRNTYARRERWKLKELSKNGQLPRSHSSGYVWTLVIIVCMTGPAQWKKFPQKRRTIVFSVQHTAL